MTAASAVRAEGLGKRYRLRHAEQSGRYVALRDVLAAKAAAPLRWWRREAGQAPATREDFWALKDVAFDIAEGEVVGIIGRNGAGKSTLLKVLSRITEPTEGRVILGGRVASLLEVGTGFHPELTGRENIFLNGVILGMSRAEVTRKFDEIVAFADVERFLDTPVKHYSSGMYVRLAFAVAAHLEPDILIVDEVLAVGDAEFQKKCLGKMHDVSRGGRTVLFVSHNMAAIQALCSRAIWLDTGTVAHQGPVDECIGRYLAHATHSASSGEGLAVPISKSLELQRFVVTPNPVASGDRLQFSLSFAAAAPIRISELAMLIYSAHEMRVAILDLRSSGLPVSIAAGGTWTLNGWIASLPLVEGDYRLGLYVASSESNGNHLGLLELAVSARVRAGDHVPYPAAQRGVVELEFGVQV